MSLFIQSFLAFDATLSLLGSLYIYLHNILSTVYFNINMKQKKRSYLKLNCEYEVKTLTAELYLFKMLSTLQMSEELHFHLHK